MIAHSAIQPDLIGLPRFAGIIPSSCGLPRKCRLRRRFLLFARSIMIAHSAIQPDLIGLPRFAPNHQK